MQLSDIRRLTPAVQHLVYFQTSGFSPLSPTSPSVRVSTHVFNTDEEMERLVAALRRSLA